MKRFIIIVLLLATGAVLALPGAVGVVAEQQQDRLVGEINGFSNQLVRERYERNWFSSESRYRYSIEDEQLRRLAAAVTEEPEGTPQLIVTTKMYHGPVPLISGGSSPLAWTDMDSSLVLRAPSGEEIELPGELRSRVEPDGSTRFIYSAAAETRALDNGLTLAWQDTRVEITLGRSQEDLGVDGDIGVIRLFDKDAEIRVGPATVASDQEKSRNGIWTGDTDIRVSSVVLHEVEADNVTLALRVLDDSDLASYAVNLGALNLRGEGLTGDARIDFLAQRLDAEALSGLLELMGEYPNGGPMPVTDRDALLRRILRGGPEITVRTLRIPMSEADLEGDAHIVVEPGTGATPRELARGLEGSATLLVPKSLIEQLKTNGTAEARNAIELMQRFRVLKPEGNRYRIEAKYAGSLLSVNGFPVPVPVF
ncbi:MAG: DUF945 family protein [Gammaproteobacteria bacterium]|nr:DUF945 family protein [Gammaproteobacteria bacterium]